MKELESLLNLSNIEIEKRLFQVGDYDFITIVDGKKHEKQQNALFLLTDNLTVELLYGGAAGGAKSWTGCSWLLFMCELYPGTRWFIGREELKRLRESTLITWFKVCQKYDAQKDVDWKYNGQDHYIHFTNGSRIDLLDLKYLPSDPLYERYGSIEYTGGWIEEGGEVNFAAFDVLKTRIGRHLNDKYGLLRKMLVTCNPKKNWIYTYFYRPYIENKLKPFQAFLKVLLFDNPHREIDYENALRSLTDPVKRARLLDGNFEYDDDPRDLCSYDAIVDCFSNEVKSGEKAISADLAMQGRDRFVAGSWNGLICHVAIDKEKSSGKSIEHDLKDLMQKTGTGRSQTVADSDGMGAYLESYLDGIKEFHGNGIAFDKKEFANVKSECGYKLAEVINNRQIRIHCTPEQQQKIIEELGLLKADNVDKDESKKRIISKEEMKELISRSPDYLDMLLMRMWFLVRIKPLEIYE